jgi:ACS family glucarate transporter-like MFS transporter
MTKPSNVRWIILALMAAASFVAYVLRTNLSVVGVTIMKEVGFTEIEFGMVLAAFAWGYGIFQFPGGIFGDMTGARKMLAMVCVSWGILTVLTGIIPGRSHASVTFILVTLIVLRFLVGATQAPLFPVVGRAIADWFPISGWAFPNGLTSTGYTLGAAATGPFIVWLVETQGWRQSFFFTAPLAFLIAALWWWYVRDYPRQHSRANDAERNLIDAGRPPAGGKREKGIWKITLKNREILLLTISYFCMNYIFYLFFSFLFYYLSDIRHFTGRQAGVLNSVVWIVGAIGATMGGFFCDRLARKYGPRWGYRLLPIPALVLAAGLLFAGAAASNPYLTVAFFSISFAFIQLTDSVYWGAMTSVAGRHAAAAGGVLNTGGNVVGGVQGLLVPLTAKYFGWIAALATGSVFALAGAILWLFIRCDIPMATESVAVESGSSSKQGQYGA